MTTRPPADLKDLAFFTDPDLDRAVGLIFELAAQLHVERQRRAALETVLIEKQLLTKGDLEAFADRADFEQTSQAALDQSLRQLLRVVSEDGDARGPLRSEALEVE